MNQGEEQGVAPTSELSPVAAGIVRAFERAAAGGEPKDLPREDHPDAVRLMDEAFGRAQEALGTNVLPFPIGGKKAEK